MSEYPSLPLKAADESEPQSDHLPGGAGIDFTDPNSPLAPYYLRASHVVAGVLLVALFQLLNHAPLWHTDIWGHLKFGQWILAHRGLPDHEPFSPYADPEPHGMSSCWLCQCGIALLYQAGEWLAGGADLDRIAGGAAVLGFTHAVLVLLRYLFLFAAFRRVSGSAALSTTGLALVMVLEFGSINVQRPQVVGTVVFVCLLVTLSRPVLSRRALVAVPLMMVLWANLHGSFGTGLLLLGAVTLGRLIEALQLSGRRQLRTALADSQLRRLVLVLLGSVLAVAVLNPLGPRIYLETVRMARHTAVQAMDEWQPIRFSLGPGGHWMYLGLLGAVLATQLTCRRWFAASSWVLVLVFAVPPLVSQRLFSWWLMTAGWIMVRYWPECAPRLRERLAGFHSVPSFRKTIVVGMLVVLAALWSIPGQWLIAGQPLPVEHSLSAWTPWRIAHQLRHREEDGPRGLPALQKHLAAHYPEGRFRGCIFTSEMVGDHFVWALAPQVPVFMYSHVHLFPPEQWLRCMAVRFGNEHWRTILDLYQVNLVVVELEHSPPLCALLREDRAWKVLADEGDSPTGPGLKQRLFVAIRIRPR
jgi:hypothetical protein